MVEKDFDKLILGDDKRIKNKKPAPDDCLVAIKELKSVRFLKMLWME